ncbi:gamma-aminobutyric acid type B receptor subunit 2-like [Babylonia areolata]|uniref:gamma-aminobutyric acid type B receptor subunit 2-like n=1 Tax=Babylonia areolata TaxID=304850 RepID=UPI003FD1385F
MPSSTTTTTTTTALSVLTVVRILLTSSLSLSVTSLPRAAAVAAAVTSQAQPQPPPAPQTQPPQPQPQPQPQPLYVQGLFPLSNSALAWKGKAMAIASQIAVQHVNQREDLLPGYRLVLLQNDTQCTAGQGARLLVNSLNQAPTKLMLLGALCSPVSEATAQVSHFWNLLQISYMSTSIALSNRERFPKFFRIVAPASVGNVAVMKLFRRFQWKRIAIVYESEGIFSTLATNLLTRAKDEGIQIAATTVFIRDPAPSIRHLKIADSRIIFAGFFQESALRAFCEAYKQGLYGPLIVWIIPNLLDRGFWNDLPDDVNCTSEQIYDVIDGAFAVGQVTEITSIGNQGIMTTSGVTPQEFVTQFREETRGTDVIMTEDYDEFKAYDATWALALCLNRTLTNLTVSGSQKRLEDFDYDDDVMATIMKDSMQSLRFVGLRSPISFNENGYPVSFFNLNQFQDGHKEKVGIYQPTAEEEKFTWSNVPIRWRGGHPPKDEKQSLHVREFLTNTVIVPFCILSAAAIALSGAFLFFNVAFRSNRVVKMSSPSLNSVILLGSMVTSASIIVSSGVGLYLETSCVIQEYMLLSGFSMAFGALFARTYRIYLIFTNKTNKRLNISDWKLLLFVAALIIFNLLVLTLWRFLDPLRLAVFTFDPKMNEAEDTEIHTYVLVCTSTHETYFLVCVLGLQLILLLFGAFLAWQTRLVYMETLKDSKIICMCIYNVVILSILGVVVSMATRKQVMVNFVATSVILLLAVVITQCLIFLPKVAAFRHQAQAVSEGQDTVPRTTDSSGHPASSSDHLPMRPRGPVIGSKC